MRGKEAFWILILICLVYSSSVSASYDYKNDNIKEDYLGGEIISGKINLSFNNEYASSSFTSNFPGNITLLELIESNGLVQNEDYNCTNQRCVPDYVAKNEISSFFLNNNSIVGIKIYGSPISQFSSFSLKVNSNLGASCKQQAVIDFFGNENKITNKKYLNETCSIKDYGCFNLGLSSDKYSEFIINNNGYCQEINLPLGPAYKVGAWIRDSTNGFSGELKMEMYGEEGEFIGNCILPKHNQSEQDLECIIEHNSVENKKYLICLKNVDYFDSPTSANYMIRTESTSPICGTDDFGETNKRDYEIYARPLKFDSLDFEINDLTYQNLFGQSISSMAEDYIEENYGNVCDDPYCILPIFFYGDNQTIGINNISVSYKIGTSQPSPERKIYSIKIEEPKISSGTLSLEISPAQFKIPVNSTQNKFELFLSGSKIVSFPINLTSSFDFDISPKFFLIGTNTQIEIVTSNNLSSAKWDFGDGTVINSTGKTITHRYEVPGTYSLKIEAQKYGGAKSIKTFEIFVGNPEESANLLIKRYESRINNLTIQINSYPSWISESIRKKVDLVGLSSSLNKIKNDFSVSTSDEQFTDVVESLIALKVPIKIGTTSSGNIPLSSTSNYLNPEYLLEISGKSESEFNSEKIRESIVSWQNQIYDSKIEFQTITSFNDKKNEDVITKFKLTNLQRVENLDEVFLFIGYPVQEITFDKDYFQKSVGDGTYIEFTGSKDFEFAIDGKVNPEELGAYISPVIDRLELEGEVSPLIKPEFKTFWFIVLACLIILGTLIVYILLQEWYKRYYEKHLFANKDDLFNLIHFIYNSRFSNLEDSDTKKKLSKSGWSREQIVYAFKKIDGKRTGMFEIPLFKFKENEKIRKEIEKRQGGRVDARFIKR